MPRPKFTKGSDVLQFSVYFSYPDVPGLESGQRGIRTNGGGWRVQTTGPEYEEIIINIQNMPETDFQALENWCENIVNWMAETFEYFDHLGTSRTVRLMVSNLKGFQTNFLNNTSGTLTLRVE
jgi:hypothetical protein